ncbi:Mitochondrial basic amino acids transporter [Porphyridium purpureum]|uniref:Mitochondrial basic amino acids transporter n=1 Tax=Porphyridium purpureum TaxID=35688 RepID=A0A5J4Z4T2_PORPP|nr:Mitochondrial basic amino acids transporter [Porphyridium purpureum]|eukprot:POR4912..scf295_1
MEEKRDGLTSVAVAGLVSGMCKTLVSHPLDTLKVYAQNQLTKPRISQLYRGVSVPILRNGVENSLHFLFRSLVLGLMAAVGGPTNPFVVGGLSGIPQSLFNCPMDYMRMQLQLGRRIQPAHLFRGIPWVALKESSSGMVFFGVYETLKRMTPLPAGAAGSLAAFSALLSVYPVDTLKTRIQAGGSFSAARSMGGFGSGMQYAVAKCLLSNFVALSVYEFSKHRMNQKLASGRKGQSTVAVLPS